MWFALILNSGKPEVRFQLEMDIGNNSFMHNAVSDWANFRFVCCCAALWFVLSVIAIVCKIKTWSVSYMGKMVLSYKIYFYITFTRNSGLILYLCGVPNTAFN